MFVDCWRFLPGFVVCGDAVNVGCLFIGLMYCLFLF